MAATSASLVALAEQNRARVVLLSPNQREARVRFKLISSILVSASLIAAAPAAAAPAASAASLSIARASAPVSGESDLAEGGGGIIALALLAGIAAILIVGELANDNGNDNPTSP